MAIPTSYVTASLINSEFGRSGTSYFSLWDARNARYGSINTWSDQYPGGPGRNDNSGYAFSDWRGYDHYAIYARVELYQSERNADADTRVTRYHWNDQYISQSWQWGTTTLRPWFTAAKGQRIDVYFDNNVGWGSYWTTQRRSIYTNLRGYLLNVYEPAGYYRNWSGTYVLSNEFIRIYNQS